MAIVYIKEDNNSNYNLEDSSKAISDIIEKPLHTTKANVDFNDIVPILTKTSPNKITIVAKQYGKDYIIFNYKTSENETGKIMITGNQNDGPTITLVGDKEDKEYVLDYKESLENNSTFYTHSVSGTKLVKTRTKV
jgi:hypothetical protein